MNTLRKAIERIPIIDPSDSTIGETLTREQIDAILDAVIASLPEPKQANYVLEGNGGVTLTEEGQQRFYRYGGYDFALSRVTELLLSAKSISKESE